MDTNRAPADHLGSTPAASNRQPKAARLQQIGSLSALAPSSGPGTACNTTGAALILRIPPHRPRKTAHKHIALGVQTRRAHSTPAASESAERSATQTTDPPSNNTAEQQQQVGHHC
jgi:hypothetical protein